MSKTKENKCDLCGLRAEFDQRDLQKSKSVDDFFIKLRELQSEKLVPKGWSRAINASIGIKNPDDLSEICAINHPSWRKPEKRCPCWQPAIGLSLGEHLAAHEARKMEILTKDIHKITAVAAFISVFYFIVQICRWLSQ